MRHGILFSYHRERGILVVNGCIRKSHQQHKKKEKSSRLAYLKKGYSQQKGIDYGEFFSPIVRHTSIRVVLALIPNTNIHLKSMALKTSSLHGNLEAQIYMEKPWGFSDNRHG